MAGTRPFLGTEISLDEIDYTVSTAGFTSICHFPLLNINPKWPIGMDSKTLKSDKKKALNEKNLNSELKWTVI